jgi:Tfp pilus assembly protein PilN
MINLLPPATKEQIRYSKYNRSALRYGQLLIGVAVILAGIFTVAIKYLDSQVTVVATDLANKKSAIAKYAPDKAVATDAANRLAAIKYIQGTQTRFSQLLYDLAAVLPKGVSISGIALTGDASKPVIVNVNGTTYDSILSFRDAIVTSPRIAGADLQNITQTTNGYTAGVVLGFKPGAAK